ncbi:MAG: hypothetical protein E6R09_12995 [Rhodocyclaceae bacterium]|nr:MAG: hypothetical protein E6R09_12995 [Rhodocyclaceae bacterium]
MYLTAENGPVTYVSVFGEIACCYNKKAENPTYRVMQQQLDLQHVPSDFYLTASERKEAEALGIHPDTVILEKIKTRQKYISINLNISAHYRDTHGTVRLHNMVGLVHSPICSDDTWWDERTQLYRLKGGLNWDHLDKDKANNSVYNLNGTTATRNKVMVDWTLEQKRQFFRDAEKLPREYRDKLLTKQ